MKMIILSAAALAAAGCAAATDSEAARASAARTETQLAEAVRGRVADAPVPCVNLRELRGNRSAGEGAIVFEGRTRRTIYVNRPNGCPELRFNLALQTRAFSTRLCSGDIATVFDPTSGIQYGSCALGDFTPYRLASR